MVLLNFLNLPTSLMFPIFFYICFEQLCIVCSTFIVIIACCRSSCTDFVCGDNLGELNNKNLSCKTSYAAASSFQASNTKLVFVLFLHLVSPLHTCLKYFTRHISCPYLFETAWRYYLFTAFMVIMLNMICSLPTIDLLIFHSPFWQPSTSRSDPAHKLTLNY